MSDIAIFAALEDGDFGFDFAMAGGDIAGDDGLRTSVILSIFLDRRANDDDQIPDGTTNRRGYWGDFLQTAAGTTSDLIGSRLWLLERAKATQANAVLAEGYCLEALQWMLEDGEAQEVKASAVYVSREQLNITIQVIRQGANGQPVNHKYDLLWNPAAKPPGFTPLARPILITDTGAELVTEDGKTISLF